MTGRKNCATVADARKAVEVELSCALGALKNYNACAKAAGYKRFLLPDDETGLIVWLQPSIKTQLSIYGRSNPKVFMADILVDLALGAALGALEDYNACAKAAGREDLLFSEDETGLISWLQQPKGLGNRPLEEKIERVTSKKVYATVGGAHAAVEVSLLYPLMVLKDYGALTRIMGCECFLFSGDEAGLTAWLQRPRRRTGIFELDQARISLNLGLEWALEVLEDYNACVKTAGREDLLFSENKAGLVAWLQQPREKTLTEQLKHRQERHKRWERMKQYHSAWSRFLRFLNTKLF